MTSHFQNHGQQQFEVVFHTADIVHVEEIGATGHPLKTPTPQDVAIYAVERMTNHGGPHNFAVDVKDEGGRTHRFEVSLWDGQWVCDPRNGEDWWRHGNGHHRASVRLGRPRVPRPRLRLPDPSEL